MAYIAIVFVAILTIAGTSLVHAANPTAPQQQALCFTDEGLLDDIDGYFQGYGYYHGDSRDMHAEKWMRARAALDPSYPMTVKEAEELARAHPDRWNPVLDELTNLEAGPLIYTPS